jgi:hypothetical protein
LGEKEHKNKPEKASNQQSTILNVTGCMETKRNGVESRNSGAMLRLEVLSHKGDEIEETIRRRICTFDGLKYKIIPL